MTSSVNIEVRSPESVSEWKKYYDLRWQVLRQPWNQPQGSEKDERENDTWHRAAFFDGQLAGVARMQMNTTSEAQIRYMAVSPDSRRLGVGRLLVNALEEIAKEEGAERIMLDARSEAVGFYLVLGYRVVADSYKLFGEIQHYLMDKELY